MEPRRLDTSWEFGKVRLYRWRTGTLNGHDEQYLERGVLESGEHYVKHSREREAWVWAGQEPADACMSAFLADGRWVEVPAEFGPDGMPTDGRPWRAVGQTWKLDDA